jgi:hypothetical protein
MQTASDQRGEPMTGGTDGQERQFDWDGDGAAASARKT